jgi:hypothetical protein
MGETKPGEWVYAETKFRRPVLTSVMWAVLFAPLLTLLFTVGLSTGRRTDIRLLVFGCVLVLVGVFGPGQLPGPAKVWFIGLMLLFGAIALSFGAGFRMARKQHAEALRKAEEMVRNS